MTSEVIVRRDLEKDLERIKSLVLSGLASKQSKIAYEKGLDSFLGWYKRTDQQVLNKACVLAYRAMLQNTISKYGRKLSSATVNLRLAAVRRLVVELSDNGLIDPMLAYQIGKVKGLKSEGIRTGNWLAKKEAQSVLRKPDTDTLKGLRDRALLWVGINSGLRRSEIAGLTIDKVVMRESRWVLLDIVGKGGRVRTVPISANCKEALDAWTKKADITSGRVFRSLIPGKGIGESMTSQAVQDVIVKYAGVSAHDLRRTYAKLARQGGSEIEQIQLSLGHASIQTTERYLGTEQSLTSAPCDHQGLKLQ